MYFNLKYIEACGLSFLDIFVLQLAKQQKFEDCSAPLGEYESQVKDLLDKKLLKKIKGKKSDNVMSLIRISKEGDDILSNIEIAEIIEEDLILFEWMKKVYLSKEKKLGNQKKTKLYIALFRVHSGIDRNKLATLFSSFTEDDHNMEFSHVLEYVFFRPQNVYSTKFDLEQSKMYSYYLTHKEYFDSRFESL